MMRVDVSLGENSYPIVIGTQCLKDIGLSLKGLPLGKDAVIITHPSIRRWHGRVLLSGLQRAGCTAVFFEVPEGERSKSARTAFDLIKKITDYSVKKDFFIVAFGGGVIGDLAGFVAAVYKRGIPFIQVPTTFLAQIDSSIGGKVGVDLPSGKNLMGAFYQPKLVFSDVYLLSTLSPRQIRNGLAEAVKYAVICDRNLFEQIHRHHKELLAANTTLLKEIVHACSRIKARVVMSDEKETKGMRTILNFGHTVGHAIEAASRYRYHHGESVALGMCVAGEISCKLGLINKIQLKTVTGLLAMIGLPTVINKLSLQAILKHMKFDKKFKAGKNKFVLMTDIGHVKVVESIPTRIITSAIKAYLK